MRIILLCIVLAATHPAIAQQGARWRLEPIATIEGSSAAEPFGELRSVALRTDGRLAVVDFSARRVALFDAAGKSIGSAGRIGAGPGETRQPYSVAWLTDTLAILDPSQSRMAFFVHGNAPLADAIIPNVTGGSFVRFYPVAAAKSYTVSDVKSAPPSATPFVGYTRRAAGDTVFSPASKDLPPTGAVCRNSGGGTNYFSWPEASRRISFPVTRAGAFIDASSGEYRLELKSSAGATLATLARAITPPPMADSVWNAGMAEYRKHVADYGAASCNATPSRPSHATIIRAVTVAADGTIWITARSAQGTTFDVFNASGQLLATLDAPSHVQDVPVAITGDRLALVAENADGAHVVRLYRIARTTAPRSP